ncbi:MAG: chloride channel protein [Gemmatimonadales bacterium]
MPDRPARPSGPATIPLAPSLDPTLRTVHAPRSIADDQARIIPISALAIGIAIVAGLVAQALLKLITFVTNISFYGKATFAAATPAANHLGLWVIGVPVVGGIIVGLMARFGSSAIRGHGIPEAMEQILTNESRIPPRLTLLKPLSAAVAIGTGGPFGAEGPIIATGGAFGSLVGQILRVTADERKVLLAAGAAAGMAATFGTPVAAVLLAVELLLFEYRSRSLIPVSLAAAAATAVRIAFDGPAPIFPMPDVAAPSGLALASYVVLGAIIGYASVLITRALYQLEDGFEELPVHWMWWPAIGAVAVGVVGYFAPRTLGVGYYNIHDILTGSIAGHALLWLVVFKMISWLVALASGTSGGTLAPLFTIGGGMGALIGALTAAYLPALGVDPRLAALVGMAAIFAGASRALLASVVFAFEVTRQPMGLLPLLAGGSAAYLVSLLRMPNTIMTEKLVRRGTPVRSEYSADYLDQVTVADIATEEIQTLAADATVGAIRLRMGATENRLIRQGYPVVGAAGELVGVITRSDLLNPALSDDHTLKQALARPPIVTYPDCTAREAANLMVLEGIGRLPVVSRNDSKKLLGMVTRSDLLMAHGRRLNMERKRQTGMRYRSGGTA